GANAGRLRWAMDLARTVRASAGLDPGAISFGAYVNAVAHPDPARARELVRGRLGVYARFSSMHRSALDTLDEPDRAAVQRLAAAYEVSGHGTSSPGHAAVLDDDFVDRFGVVGPSDRVAERLLQLLDLGLDHLVIVGHARDVDFKTLVESVERFGQEVIPSLKAPKAS
ncbi:MAG: LLM class flavin-dependent oxidoreductase, partial [Chloroflexota bacterium]|nr:LLM class flavin-dependent oxidoreductase [Chloroflexota bacterium]